MGPKNTRSRAGGPKGNELKLINLELVIMGFYTILNIGQLTGDNLISPGAPVNNCRWASIQWTWDQCVKAMLTEV